MRVALIGLAAATWISTASAQVLSTSENGLGPYHFGMTLADAQATAPRAAWHIDEGVGRGRVLSGGPRLQVGADRFAASFVFDESGLRFIALTGQAPSSCNDAVRTRVEGELEPNFGAFRSAPGPRESGGLVTAFTTALGSEIRERTDETGAHIIYSSRRGGMFIQVKGEPLTNDQGCRLSLVFNAQAPYTGPLLTPISFEELDRAQSLVGPQWISRPVARAFEQNYPEGALYANVEGRATLDCLVNMDGSLRCLVGDETPMGGGFGEAALHIAQGFRVLRNEAGVAAPGKRVRVPITFRISGGPEPVGPSRR